MVLQLPGDLLLHKARLKLLYRKFDQILSQNKINEWIMQFDPEHRDIAITLAQKLSYFSEQDVEHFCRKLNSRLPAIGVTKPRFVGFGQTAESGPFVSFFFRKANGWSKKLFTPFENILRIDTDQHDAIVLMDDMIGTGDQAMNLWSKTLNILVRRPQPRIVYLALVGFHDAKQKLAARTGMHIELAHELTDVDRAFFSPTFGDYFKTEEAKKILKEYGMRLEPSCPLGYGDSAALVAFFYDTPNNTLPVVWSKNNWIPLFERREARPSVTQSLPSTSPSKRKHQRKHTIDQQLPAERLDAYADYLKKHEALWDWEVPEGQVFLDALNSKGRSAIIEVGTNRLYSLSPLAVSAGLAAGRDTAVALSSFCGLSVTAFWDTIEERQYNIQTKGARLVAPKLHGKMVIFDWSNTLVDEYELDEAICSFIPFRSRGGQRGYMQNTVRFREILSDLEQAGSHLWYDYVYLAKQFGKSKVELRKAHDINADKLRPLCAIEDLIDNIRQSGLKVALLTNCVRQVLNWRAEILGLELGDLFDFVITSDEVGSCQDKGAHLDHVLEKSGIQASEIIMVGDNFAKDVLPAKGRHLQTVWLKNSGVKKRSYWGTPELPVKAQFYELSRSSIPGRAADIMILNITHLATLL
jgi:FMN phosphatase YigB (HAD superfamily)